MLKAAKELYDLGFAIHWLRDKSKMPVESGWTKGPRKSWAQVESSYRKGFNLGVRLGQASHLGHGYLAVIDCDVKSDTKFHQIEMEDRLSKIKGLSGPVVISGRGNGSRHIYFVTEKPQQPFRFAQAAEKVKVPMPSVPPTAYERERLSDKEIAAGIRYRPAWEISVMGEGQQVVLPPSIHPDSGKEYEWAWDAELKFPLLALETPGTKTVTQDTGAPFTAAPVSLLKLAADKKLSPRILDLITDGKDCPDRSAGLMSACIALLKAGLSDNEILTVLTDRDLFLGQAAYDHAQTGSRASAAAWVRKYTLAKAKDRISAAHDFENAAEIAPLGEVEARTQAVELLTRDWKQELLRTGDINSPPRATLRNVHLILTNEASPGVVACNEFSMTDSYTEDTPWGGMRDAELRDIDTVRIKAWLSRNYRVEPSDDKINQALMQIADENRFHPVRDFLDGLEWDGKPRIDSWLEKYLRAKGPGAYLRAVGRKTIVAMIARVMNPGVKFDQVLILEGVQGCGKSTAVRILADPWFSDATLNLADKDAVLAMRSSWVLELGELSAMRRADVNTLKEFVSRQIDRIRAPYGRRVEAYPRQCIFIGTTNSSEYLKDTTGNRRFWPVSVGQVDFESLEQDRNQLLAEAKFSWEMGEKLYLDSHAERAEAEAQQYQRTLEDEWVGVIAEYMCSEHDNFNVTEFTIDDLFSEWGPLKGWKMGRSEQMRAAEALRMLKYRKVRRMRGRVRKWTWVKEEGPGHEGLP